MNNFNNLKYNPYYTEIFGAPYVFEALENVFFNVCDVDQCVYVYSEDVYQISEYLHRLGIHDFGFVVQD